jgi:hypothetical protein
MKGAIAYILSNKIKQARHGFAVSIKGKYSLWMK